MGLAALIGILLGSLAGYFGDARLRLTRAQLACNVLGLFFGCFYAFGVRGYVLSDALGVTLWGFIGQLLISFLVLAGIVLLFNAIAWLLRNVPWLGTRIPVPVDIMISRLIEVMVSVPTLFLIIALIAVSKPSVFMVMVVIGLTSWTDIARFIRGELLRVRNLEYVEAAQAMG